MTGSANAASLFPPAEAERRERARLLAAAPFRLAAEQKSAEMSDRTPRTGGFPASPVPAAAAAAVAADLRVSEFEVFLWQEGKKCWKYTCEADVDTIE